MKHEVRVLIDTLRAFDSGHYHTETDTVPVKLRGSDLYQAEVFLPDALARLEENCPKLTPLTGRCRFLTENTDSFSMALKIQKEDPDHRVLVLNLANPVNPGGGVRRGARAQEEDLCRRSSLLINLEGEQAYPYYDYNRGLYTYMGSDALIISDQIEVIKDEHYQPLNESVIVSVLTCAAPNICNGMEGMSDEEYYDMLKGRIEGMLKAAAFKGYRRLVLGAFGCGAFRNDARIVAKAFHEVFESFRFCDLNMDQLFISADFAVLCRSDTYNYDVFSSYFKGE